MKMKQVFGRRVAMTVVEEEYKGLLLRPADRHRANLLGRVNCAPSVPTDVKEGMVVLFQASDFILTANSYGPKDTPQVVMPLGDIIAVVDNSVVALENFRVVDEWVLLRLVNQRLSNTLVIPDSAIHTHNEFTRFVVEQVGSQVNVDMPGRVALDVKVGDEVVMDRGRCNPIQFEGAPTAFAYATCGAILGVLDGDQSLTSKAS